MFFVHWVSISGCTKAYRSMLQCGTTMKDIFLTLYVAYLTTEMSCVLLNSYEIPCHFLDMWDLSFLQWYCFRCDAMLQDDYFLMLQIIVESALSWRWRHNDPSKCQELLAQEYIVILQKTENLNFWTDCSSRLGMTRVSRLCLVHGMITLLK